MSGLGGGVRSNLLKEKSGPVHPIDPLGRKYVMTGFLAALTADGVSPAACHHSRQRQRVPRGG